jgi:signal transduction histidine kinase
LEAGEVAVHPERFTVGHIRDTLMGLFANEIEEKHLDVRWEIDSKMPEFFSDRIRLTKVFRNLIDNAIKFTEKGSVRVRVSFSSDTKRVQCEVEDTGVGIPSTQFKAIFDPFHQVDSSPRRLYGGMGLGLRNVKGTLELLGGGIDVESTVDKGSLFRFWFPAEYTEDN